MKTNTMKSKLLAGEAALGCSIMVPSPQMVEMVAHAGFDWVLIDLEHGTIGLETAELMIMAAEASGITPIARPRSNRPQDISSVMDRGAMGVQVQALLDEMRIDPVMTEATRRFFERSTTLGLAGDFTGKPESMRDVIVTLLRRTREDCR